MRGIDVLVSRLSRMARRQWLVSTLAACVLSVVAVYAMVARYHLTTPVPDRGFAYTSAEAYGMLARLGETGRHGLMLIHAFDYAYLVAYALFFGTAIAGVASRLNASSVWLHRLAVLPVLAAIADLFENVSVDAAILAFPRRLDLLLGLAGGFTTFKATVPIASQLLLVVGFMLLLARRLRVRVRDPIGATD